MDGEGDAQAARMDEGAMTALASAIAEACAFEVGDQFPEFLGHDRIKTILPVGACDLSCETAATPPGTNPEDAVSYQ